MFTGKPEKWCKKYKHKDYSILRRKECSFFIDKTKNK